MATCSAAARRIRSKLFVLGSIGGADRRAFASPLPHHHEEVIAQPAHQRPPGYAAINTPQPTIGAAVPLPHRCQIGWWYKQTQPAEVLESEVPLERPIKLARTVVARPDGVLVHSHGHGVAGKAHLDARPVALPQVVDHLPRANAADDAEYERAPRREQPRALAREIREIGHAIERPEIGIRAVIGALSFPPVKLVRTHSDRLDAIGRALAFRPLTRPL